MKPKEDRKLRVLAWGDYGCTTGFGTVMSNIMRQLDKTDRYDLTVIGINHSGDPIDHEKWPGKVWPAMPGMSAGNGPYADVYGRQRLLDMAGSGEFDIIFLLQDTFVVETIMEQLIQTQEVLAKQGAPFKIIYYYPIDSNPKPDWIHNVVSRADFPVVYTKFGKLESEKIDQALDLPVIYHGTNIDDFHYIDNRDKVMEFRRQWFKGIGDGKFLIINVNRNQPRKDIVRSLMVLDELKHRGRDVFLYLHMQHEDVGGNIVDMAEQLDLKIGEDYSIASPKVMSANQGIPVEQLNTLYNAADCVLTTTLGEGWGLSVTEAMATKTPIVAPNNTSLTEMLADRRGLLVSSGGHPSMYILKENDLNRIRPLMSVPEAADAIESLMDATADIDIEGAYNWAQSLTWENIVRDQWLPIFEHAGDMILRPEKYMSRQQRRALERTKQKKAGKQ